MKVSKVLITLAWLIAILALVAALTGIFYQDGGRIFQFKTLRGETVPIWGQGLYRYDSPIGAVGFMAADAVTIVLAIPFLLVSTILYGRGSLKGGCCSVVRSPTFSITMARCHSARRTTTCF